jgi:hypothetical protein
MQDEYPQYRVAKIYDHREGDQFLTLYETEDENATPIWVSSFEGIPKVLQKTRRSHAPSEPQGTC